MKNKNNLHFACCILAVVALFMTSCGTSDLLFYNSTWKVLDNSIKSSDGRFSFQLFDKDIPIDSTSVFITNNIDCDKYNNVEKYLNNICNNMPFDIDTILAYSPTMGVMYVMYHDYPIPAKPISITSSIMSPDQFYTAWVRPDDEEKWIRKNWEIYTNVVLNKRKHYLAIIDRMTYRKTNIARIEIIQSETSNSRSLGFPPMTFHWADVNSVNSIEVVSDIINNRRRLAIINYLKGFYYE